MQNLENKRFILPLCARSLSLKDLHAKSREHGSYGGRRTVLTSHFGTGTGWAFGTGSGRHAIARVRLSKIGDYLPDNVSCLRLSGLGHAVNDKTAETSLQWNQMQTQKVRFEWASRWHYHLALHTRSLASMLAASFPGRAVRPIQPKNRVPMSNARFVRNLLSMSFAPSFNAGGWIKENLQGEDKYNETRR